MSEHRWKTRSMTIACIPLIAVLFTACQSGKPADALSINSKTEPTKMVVAVAKAMQKCWFKSGDSEFKQYRLANETNSYSGRPRVMLVPRNNPGGLPALVVQAEEKGSASNGKYTNMQTFGPILSTSSGKRITDDVNRWAKGNPSCA